jgi:hypothetical protein
LREKKKEKKRMEKKQRKRTGTATATTNPSVYHHPKKLINVLPYHYSYITPPQV